MGISVANYKVKLNGSEFSKEWLSAIEEIIVEDEINLPAMFSIQLSMVDYLNGKWRGIDLKAFKPGDKIEVFLGLDKVQPMISGEITSLSLNLSDHSQLELRGYDFLHRLRMGTRNKTFIKKKDSEIASEIIKEHGLTAVVDDTKTIYSYMFQNNQSNYEFLITRAAMLDYEIYAEDKKIHFIKSRAKKSPEIPKLTFRKDFQQLDLELRSLTRGSKVEVRGWDVKEKKEITAKAKKGDEVTKMGGKESGYDLISKSVSESPIALSAESLVDMSEAQSIATAAYNSLLKDFITGEGKCYGNSVLKAGKTVELLGMDDRFSGIYYIVSTIHTVNSKGYTTIFKVKRTGI